MIEMMRQGCARDLRSATPDVQYLTNEVQYHDTWCVDLNLYLFYDCFFIYYYLLYYSISCLTGAVLSEPQFPRRNLSKGLMKF